MDIMDKFKSKSKDEMMSKEDARDLIVSWADQLMIDPDSDKFEEVIKAIQYLVRKELLIFNSNKKNFEYTLLEPVRDNKTDEVLFSKFTISEMDMTQKQVVQKYKDNESIQQATALMAESLGMSEKVGFVGRIKGRDSDTINAVIMGFFTGAGS